ncbi:MAG: hypothetical protein B7Z75_05125 [Acidocella sp. 20-57-95]|nr:MAG: hypothetical protein B7Z75_05125 [Acidocella sp. 20-57-95]OYV59628.1 MAG: hypothetical protein B7Z71_07660 [Acidocella sp. 21-58-7]HQT64673.1 DUF962 domain-containing protein [Acidocella sp.]HQU04862.1 DUF962 domain-containing protein [Acidocella sp.]
MDTAKLDSMIEHYAQSHRNKRNEIIHCVCVPAIVFAVIGLIYAFSLTMALIAVIASVIYYARLGLQAAVEMAVILVAMLAVWSLFGGAHHLAIVAIVIFGLAWVGQFIGHYYEGAKPSFLDDVQYLMIGPLFVISVLKPKLKL